MRKSKGTITINIFLSALLSVLLLTNPLQLIAQEVVTEPE